VSLTSELQQSLEYLRSKPNRPPVRSREVPAPFVRDIRRHVLQVIQSHPNNIDRSAIRRFEHPYRVPHEIQEFYTALLDVGVEEEDSLRRFLLWFLDNQVLRIPETEPLSDSEQIILEIASASRRYGSQWEDYGLVYALENHLCHYGNGMWHLTGLGRTFLRLSSLQATRFLLSLELFLYAGEWDEWHMSRTFLSSFLQEQEMARGVHQFPFVWAEYLERLEEFGLAGVPPDDPDVVRLTSLGELTIESVLAQDSAFDSLVPLYVREEMTGAEAPDFASEEDFDRIGRLLEKSPLVGELKKPILDEVERLRQANAPYLSIFKALAPCIEGILRNLSRIEHIVVRGIGLGAYIEAFEKAQQPILKPGTLQMIDTVFRPYRNIVEHGHVIAPEPARMLCEISLSVIEQIHKDYLDFKG
jgi:hypothetical protein